MFACVANIKSRGFASAPCQIPRYVGGPTTVYLAVAGIYTYIPVLCPWVPAWALSTPHTQYNGIWGYTIILVYLPHTPIGPIPGGRRCDRCRDARWLTRLLHHRWRRAVRCSCGMHIWAHMPLYTLVQGTGGARYALPRCTVLHTMCTAVRTVLPDGMCAMADPFHHAFAGSIALCMSCRTCTQFRTERWIRSGTGFGPVGTDPSPGTAYASVLWRRCRHCHSPRPSHTYSTGQQRATRTVRGSWRMHRCQRGATRAHTMVPSTARAGSTWYRSSGAATPPRRRC